MLLLELPVEILVFLNVTFKKFSKWQLYCSSLICNTFDLWSLDLKDLETYDPGSWIITSTTGSQHQNNKQNSSTMRRRSSKSPPADDSLRFDFSLKLTYLFDSDLSLELSWDSSHWWVTFWQKMNKFKNILLVTSNHQFIFTNLRK